MLKVGSCSTFRAGLRSFSTTSCRPTVTETIDSMANKFREAVRHSHSEEYEGVTERGLRMLVFGKPGSGKGTLSARLVKDYDIHFVSTGDVLRKEIMAKSEVGKRAEAVVASGGLVPDELMLDVVKTELDRLRGKSWIIDGFPRTLHQGELLDEVLANENRPLNMIVHLNVPDSVIMARIAARWVHLPSGRVYNTTYSAPKVPGKDDVTGEPLSKRPDDTPETFSKRLKAYYESTAPLLKYFADHYPDSLFSLTGSTSDEVPHSPSSSREGPQAQQETSPSSSSSSSSSITASHSHSHSAAAAFAHHQRQLQTNSDPVPPGHTPYIATPSTTYVPNLELDNNDNAKSAVDQLWPKLEALIQPFGLHRARGRELEQQGVEGVRQEADDLRDPEEDVHQAQEARGPARS